MLLLAGLALAAEPRSFDWTVTVDPLTAALGFAHVQVERAIGPHLSVYAGPSLRLYDGIYVSEATFRGYGAELGVRGFLGAKARVSGPSARESPASELRVSPPCSAGPSRGPGGSSARRPVFRGFRAPCGPWAMVRGVLAHVVSDGEGAPGGYASALVGYTAILGPGLVLSGGAGISWFDYGPPGAIHGFLPALHTNVGWAF